jgi:hypothetical protein
LAIKICLDALEEQCVGELVRRLVQVIAMIVVAL